MATIGDPLATFGPPPSAEDPVWDGDGTEFFEEVPIMDPPRPTTLDSLFGCCVREPGDLTAVGLLADALAEDLPGEGDTRLAESAGRSLFLQPWRGGYAVGVYWETPRGTRHGRCEVIMSPADFVPTFVAWWCREVRGTTIGRTG